jgi:H+-translocating NAD(P) transhydrogenase subunit alpha
VIAIAFGTINIVGGFLVTDRMLGMFRGRRRPTKEDPESGAASSASPPGAASATGEGAGQ